MVRKKRDSVKRSFKISFLRIFILVLIIVSILFLYYIYLRSPPISSHENKNGNANENIGESVFSPPGMSCSTADLNKNGKIEEEDLKVWIKDFLSDCRNIVPYDHLTIRKELEDILNNPASERSCTASNNLCTLLDLKIDGILTPFDLLTFINLANSCDGKTGSPNMNSFADLNEDSYVNGEDRTLLLSLLLDYPIGTRCN